MSKARRNRQNREDDPVVRLKRGIGELGRVRGYHEARIRSINAKIASREEQIKTVEGGAA